MDALSLGFLAIVFVFAASLAALALQTLRGSRFAEKRAVRRRLGDVAKGGSRTQARLTVAKDGSGAKAGTFGDALLRIPGLQCLNRFLLRSKTRLNTTTFILLSLALGIIGLMGGLRLLPQPGAAVVLGAAFGALPYVKLKANARALLRRVEEQLPETLDLMARGMRSGHALTSAMAMVAEEMADPVAGEFGATVDQINFGLSPEEALENLCDRVPSADLRFFAITVLVHKETGGNIADVFEKISQLIRQRLQFRNQVKAMTAEGRYSALVLLLLPVALFAFLYVQNFDYVSVLWQERAGRILLITGICMQFVGWLVMKRMVRIEV
ncbi:MAG: type II secretion system F family protein [Deltaproteobacteria bacterium]|nr:type II secretion system F family protein [Deltaproteobacteria bacterium]